MSELLVGGPDPVVVVGAGPCGLVAACELRRRGVAVRVLEAEAQAATGSRAIILWPPTLEVLDELGVLEAARAGGVTARALAYHMGGGVLRLELGAENEPLLLPQEVTGRLLERALIGLGGQVEYGVRVTGVADTEDAVTVRYQGPDGAPGSVRASWVVGADGLGSTVRRELGTEFAGDAVESRFLLAEGEVRGEFAREEVHYFLGPAGVLLLSPLPGGRARISGPVPADLPLTQEAVQEVLDRRGPGGLEFAEPSAIADFTSQERIAAELRTGRVFLVGDAAHVHSAVGGQGLNLGVQDARNLGWKLAGVVGGTLAPAVLDSYGPERREVAEQVVRTTGRMIRQAAAGPVRARLRNGVWRLMDATGVLRRWYAPMLAGRLTRYRSGALGGGAGRPPRGLPGVGTRTPGWAAGAHALGFRLVTLGAEDGPLSRSAAGIASRLGSVVVHEHDPRTDHGAGFLLLRPDGFVAAAGRTAEALDGVGVLLDGLATGAAVRVS